MPTTVLCSDGANNPEFIKVSQNEYYQGTERNNPKEVDENLTVVETQIEVQDPV